MYNAEQKRAFIMDFSDKISIVKYAFDLFEGIAPYEESLNSDICTWDAATLQPVVEKFCGIRDQSKVRPLYILRGYAEWCTNHGVPGACRAVFEIRDISADKMRRQMIKHPAQLQVYLDALFDPEDEETTDNNFRTYFWLSFAGMKEEDILQTQCLDVDLRHMRISHNGTDYPLYSEGVPAVMNSANLTSFVFKNDNYAGGKSYRDRIPGDLIMRGIRAVPSIQTIRVELSRHLRDAKDAGRTQLELTPYRVWLSGMFYRKWIAEQAGQSVDFSAEARLAMGDRVYKLDIGRNTQAAKFRELVHDYEIDYQRWKTTFN